MSCLVYVIFQTCDMFCQSVIYGLKYTPRRMCAMNLTGWTVEPACTFPFVCSLLKTSIKYFYKKLAEYLMVNKVLSEIIKSNWKQNIRICLRRQIHMSQKKTAPETAEFPSPLVSRFLTAPWGCGECTSLSSLQLQVFSRACYVQLRSGEVTSTITLPVIYKPHWSA